MLNVYCWRQTLHLTLVQSTRNISEIFWTYLHLRLLDRIVSFFHDCQSIPLWSFLPLRYRPFRLVTGDNRCATRRLYKSGTVSTAVLVIITILGGKWHTRMMTKGITSGTYQKKKMRNIGVRLVFRRVFASCKFDFLQQ